MNNTERSILSLFHEEMIRDEKASQEALCNDNEYYNNGSN